ncbi:MAG: S8 family serine peptidase, partial [Bacteroidota bacterium]
YWSGGVELVDAHSPPQPGAINSQPATTPGTGTDAATLAPASTSPAPVLTVARHQPPANGLDWSLLRLKVQDVWQKAGTRGKGIKVAVLDTSLFDGHQEIDNANIIARKNFTQGEAHVTTDKVGHGSFCTGLIAAQGKALFGVAPEVSLLIGKVTNFHHKVKEGPLLKGIEWACEQGADIISISLFLDVVSDAFKQKVKSLIQTNKVLIVAASGNDGDVGLDIDRFPASLPNCLSVGASNHDDKIAAFSTRTQRVNLFVPGTKLTSLGTKDKDEYKLDSGTSMSTAVMSGIIAVLMSAAQQKGQNFSPRRWIEMISTNAQQFVTFPHQSFPNYVPLDKPFPLVDPLRTLQSIQHAPIT